MKSKLLARPAPPHLLNRLESHVQAALKMVHSWWPIHHRGAVRDLRAGRSQ